VEEVVIIVAVFSMRHLEVAATAVPNRGGRCPTIEINAAPFIDRPKRKVIDCEKCLVWLTSSSNRQFSS
jgi:hypothetical protein